MRIAPEGERLRTVAFCERDYAPMAQVLKDIEKTWPALDGRRNRKVTMDQIEKMKGTGTRKRAAKATAPARRARKTTVTASKA